MSRERDEAESGVGIEVINIINIINKVSIMRVGVEHDKVPRYHVVDARLCSQRT